MHATGLIKGLDPKEYRRLWHLKNRERRLVANKERYRDNREQRLAASKAYRLAHPDVTRKAVKKYQQANREKCRQRCRDWYKRNAESERAKSRAERKAAYADPVKRGEILRRHREWARANKTQITANSAKRYARKKGATLGDPKLIAEWMRHVRSLKFVRCHWCGTKVPGPEVHFDHVIALNKRGSHSIGNICASCPECNLSKQDRSLADWIKKDQLFLQI